MKNKLRSKKSAAACYNLNMSTSGHTNSDGAKSRKHGFLFKKFRLGAIVFLAFVLTIVGSVGSTVLADPTNDGGIQTENDDLEAVASMYKAKYYSMLMAYCMSVPINLDASVSLPGGGYSYKTSMGDADDALTILSAWDGVYKGDDSWYESNKAHFPAMDTIYGTVSQHACSDTTFGVDKNQGLIAAWIESLVKVHNNDSQFTGSKYYIDTSKLFKEYSIEQKAALFSRLGYVPRDEDDDDKRIRDGKKDDSSDYTSGTDMEDIVYAHDWATKFNGNQDRQDEITLNIHNYTEKKAKGKYSVSDAITDVQRIAANFVKGIKINELTDEEKYVQYYLAYSGRCSDYNKDNTFSKYTEYSYPVITLSDNNTSAELTMAKFKVPDVVDEGTFKAANFLNFSKLTSANTAYSKDVYTTSVSCRSDSIEEYNNLTKKMLSEKYAPIVYSSCASAYKADVAKKQEKIYELRKENDVTYTGSKTGIYVSLDSSSISKLTFSDDSAQQQYDDCRYGYKRATGEAVNMGAYECNKKYFKQYFDPHKEELESAAEDLNIGTVGSQDINERAYEDCWNNYDGNPYAISDSDYIFTGQDEDFTRTFKKFQCTRDYLSSLDETSIRSNYLEQYNKIVEVEKIYAPLEEYIVTIDDLSDAKKVHDDNEEYFNTALDNLVDVDVVGNAATRLFVDSREPKRAEVAKILIGISDVLTGSATKVACGVDDYLEEVLPSDFEEKVGVAKRSGYSGTKLQSLIGDNEILHPGDPGYTDPGNYISTETCEGQVVMGWVICQAARFMTDAASKIYDSISETWIAMDRKETSQESGTYTVWQSFVNIANIILVILFLFVIFSQLTGYGIDNYGIKRVLPKLIMVAILINLSFIICQIVVDVTNIIGVNIEGFLDNIDVGSSSLYESPGDGGIVNFIGNLLAVAGLGAVGIGVTFKVLDHNLLSFLFGALIVLLVVLIAILFFFVQLGIRKAAVITLIAISPLAIVCYALPNTKKYFDKWLNGFKALMLVYPMCGLVQGMSRLIARMMSDASSSFIGAVVIAAILVFPYFFIPSLVAKAVSAVTSLGERMSQLGRGIRKRATDGIKNTEHYKEAQDRRKDAEALRRGTTREAIEQRHRRRNGVDATQVADAEAQRRAAINTLSDPNSSIADRRRARRELAAANRTLGRAKDIQKYEDNYLNKQKEAQETAARAGYQGDYVATMDAAQGRAAQNAFNVKMGDAENLSPEITIEMARHQARMKVEDTELSLDKQEQEYGLRGGDNTFERQAYQATMRNAQRVTTESEFNKRRGQAHATRPEDIVSLEEATHNAEMHQEDERISREKNRLEYNARQQYQIQNGRSYEQVMTDSLEPGVNTEFNTKIAQAENPAAEVDIATARTRVAGKRRSEAYQAYSEQYGAMTPAQQKELLGNLLAAQTAGTGDANMDDIRALTDVMIKMGASDDVQEVLGAAYGAQIGTNNGTTHTVFSQTDWNAIRTNQTRLDSLIEIMGKTGTISGKGYAKYLAKMSAAGNASHAVSYEEWIRNGDSGPNNLRNDDVQYNSFDAFVNANYQGGDVVDKMSKNEMKFVISQTRSEGSRSVPAGSRTISKFDAGELKKGAIGKTGDELRYANDMIALKKADFIGSGHSASDFYRDLHLGPAEISKLDLTTLIAIVGRDPTDPTGQTPDPTALAQFITAIGTSLGTARIDPRIAHNLRDERIRPYLGL